jgi:hypothetical protein
MSNLSSLSLVLLAAVHLTGLLALVWGATLAPEGYEDATGFHLGREPLPRAFAGGGPAKGEKEHGP